MRFVLKLYVFKMSYILHFEDWNFGQFLRVDKTCFLRPGHIAIYYDEVIPGC